MSEENKPTPQSEADKEKELAAKRNAFLRYMTIIFAVAFLLVLISLVLQAHTAKAALSDLKESNSSALSNAAVNAELLQDENRKLQEELDSTKKLLADEQEKAKTQEESITQLEQELEQIRAQGYAVESGELQIGLKSVAAPVFDPDGQCEYAISAVTIARSGMAEIGRAHV